ncbi:hypothetical protein RvY_07145-2 [Ramazzottius varieornatus]|uniref:Uncharacterized protein n=1 Tax=Ramazzottius varieornatus TaxID=947166 RepID=A0A1D1V4B1_RAMVA|nr:hypothetical protein RvY_07145-2 [Ramazzottius varieornatus]
MAERINPIISLFFSEFDNRAGPVITFEVPEGRFSSSGLFDQISSYIIPKPELMARQLTISSGPFKVVGYPIQIDNAKYARNALMFNVCFVFDECANVSPYEPIVKKLGEYLRTAEVEACLISTETSKITLPELMLRLLTDLNNLGRCSVELNKSSTLFLKVVPANRNKSAAVHDFDVPILASNFTSLAALEDLTTRQIVPLIDGVKNVHQISDEVDADPDLVKSCVQNMMLVRQLRPCQCLTIAVPNECHFFCFQLLQRL